MQSLRSRLMLGTAAATAALFALLGVAVFLAVRSAILSEFDATLVAKAQALAAMTEQDSHGVHLDFEASQLPEFQRSSKPEYFQLWLDDGTTLAKSPSLIARHSPVTSTGPAGSASADRQLSHSDGPNDPSPVVLPDDRAGRQVVLHFQPRLDDEDKDSGKSPHMVWLAVGYHTSGIERILRTIAGLLAGVCGGATIAAVGVMALVVRRGLRPATELAGRIAAVGATDLSQRIELAGTPRELSPVVQRTNELLTRLDAALTREKAFTADAAHELRTPLAGLQTALEVCASRPRDAQAYQQTLASCLRAVRGMHRMVENLLLLARADARQLRITKEPIAAEPFLQECWAACAGRAAERRLRVVWRVPADAVVNSDPEKLGMVMGNLFENAVAYADESGDLLIALAERDGVCQLQVANSARGMETSAMPHVFERFWRSDAARSEAGAHCGLGLALCRKLMEALGGSATATLEEGRFVVTVVFPRS